MSNWLHIGQLIVLIGGVTLVLGHRDATLEHQSAMINDLLVVSEVRYQIAVTSNRLALLPVLGV